MRTLHTFATVCVLAAAALLPACSSSDDDSPGGGAGAPGAAGATSGGDATKGAKVWSDQVCGSCHGEDAKGDLAPNITPSVTAGIGSWTYQQFHDAVRSGLDTDGTMLCLLMSRYDTSMITEAQMADLYAYVKTKPVSDVMKQGSYCP